MGLENLSATLAAEYDTAEAGTHAVDMEARACSLERRSGLETAVRLIDKALQASDRLL